MEQRRDGMLWGALGCFAGGRLDETVAAAAVAVAGGWWCDGQTWKALGWRRWKARSALPCLALHSHLPCTGLQQLQTQAADDGRQMTGGPRRDALIPCAERWCVCACVRVCVCG